MKDPALFPQKGDRAPNFRPMSIVAKRSPVSASVELLLPSATWIRQRPVNLRSGDHRNITTTWPRNLTLQESIYWPLPHLRIKLGKVYEIREQYRILDPHQFLQCHLKRLSFLCKKWCDNEQLAPGLRSTYLDLSGGFKKRDKERGADRSMGVLALKSTQ